jgi:hypothetical protein
MSRESELPLSSDVSNISMPVKSQHYDMTTYPIQESISLENSLSDESVERRPKSSRTQQTKELKPGRALARGTYNPQLSV